LPPERRLDVLIAIVAVSLMVTLAAHRSVLQPGKSSLPVGNAAVTGAATATRSAPANAKVVPAPRIAHSMGSVSRTIALESEDIAITGKELDVKYVLRNLTDGPRTGVTHGRAAFVDSTGRVSVVASATKPAYRMARFTIKGLSFARPTPDATLKDVTIIVEDERGRTVLESVLTRYLGSAPGSTDVQAL
jgi:hypothetical protein